MKRQRKLRNTDITRPTDVSSISGSVQQLPLAIVSNLDNAQTNESAVELKTKRKRVTKKLSIPEPTTNAKSEGKSLNIC